MLELLVSRDATEQRRCEKKLWTWHPQPLFPSPCLLGLPLPAEAHLICAHSEQARECAHWDIPVHRWVEVELVLLCAPLIDIDVVNPGPWMFMVL